MAMAIRERIGRIDEAMREPLGVEMLLRTAATYGAEWTNPSTILAGTHAAVPHESKNASRRHVMK
jgi:hypothetical protein